MTEFSLLFNKRSHC